eukprot:807227_1
MGGHFGSLRWGTARHEPSNYQIDEWTEKCDKGDGVSCHNLGVWYDYLGRKEKAREMFEAALFGSLEFYPSAKMLADMCRKGEGGPIDLERARRVLLSACQALDGGSCSELAEMHEMGELVTTVERASTVTEENGGGFAEQARAAKLYQRGCRFGSHKGCARYGRMLAEGRGVAQDFLEAAALFSASCEMEHPESCLNLAGLYEHGQGLPRNIDKAKILLREACIMSNWDEKNVACMRLKALNNDQENTESKFEVASSMFPVIGSAYDDDDEDQIFEPVDHSFNPLSSETGDIPTHLTGDFSETDASIFSDGTEQSIEKQPDQPKKENTPKKDVSWEVKVRELNAKRFMEEVKTPPKFLLTGNSVLAQPFQAREKATSLLKKHQEEMKKRENAGIYPAEKGGKLIFLNDALLLK